MPPRVLDPLLRPSGATALSRRRFLGMAAFAAGAGSLPALSRPAMGPLWLAVREIAGTGAIGAIVFGSAMVPARAADAPRLRFGCPVPGGLAHVLDGMLFAMVCERPVRVRTASHAATGSYSMTCFLGGDRRLAIVRVPPQRPFAAMLRGTRGSLYVTDKTIQVETSGAWQEVAI